MLIDAKHTRWILVTTGLAVVAIVLHYFLGRNTPDGLRGGSAVGLWYGIAGSLLMGFAGLLAAHRRLASLRWLPARRWLGSRQAWLRGHIWLGLLSVVLVVCHSGYSLGGPLEIALWVILALTILSGMLGLVAQMYLPHLMTNRLEAEAPYEQIPHLCDAMRRDADDTVEAILARPDLSPAGREAVRTLHEQLRSFLQQSPDSNSPLHSTLQSESLFAQMRGQAGLAVADPSMQRLETLCEERRQFLIQMRLHLLLHGWLLVHIPISIALVVLGVVHAVMSVYW